MLMPVFFFTGGSELTPGTGIFSELNGLPLMEAVADTEPGPARDEVSTEAVSEGSSVAETGCRWQADRVLLSELGQAKNESSKHPASECVSGEGLSRGTPAVNRVIRDKVDALTLGEYPFAAMAESVAQYDTPIAGLIVGIAKKESNWGKRTPKLRGEECFNYWGYRGPGNRGLTEDGYGCFEKPADAVHAIGERLIELSELRGATEPARMVVWKCGSSCAAHSPESVKKWISDVDVYYRQFLEQSS